MNRYYKCDRDSVVGKALVKFHRAANHAARRADDYAKKFGASFYIQPVEYFEGGVDFLEFEGKEPNPEIWRKRTDLGETPYYEPRCTANGGVLVLPDNRFHPSDTWNTVYNKEHYEWAQIKDKKPLEYWAAIIRYTLTGDKDKDWAAVDAQLANKWFVNYVGYTGDQKINRGKAPGTLRRAIAAEKARVALPVVKTETLYALLGFKWPKDAEDMKKLARKLETPTFFTYKDNYYICVQGECEAQGLFEIDERMFIFQRNSAINDQRRKAMARDEDDDL